MALTLFKVKPGAGTTNDGNACRTFFNNPEISADTLGLNPDLLKNFRTLLYILNNPLTADIETYHLVSREIKQVLHSDEYSWNSMYPTIHKMLEHGESFMVLSPLPPGALSESAMEACNKHNKRYREHQKSLLTLQFEMPKLPPPLHIMHKCINLHLNLANIKLRRDPLPIKMLPN